MLQLATPIALCVLPLPWLLWRLLPAASPSRANALPVPFFQHTKTTLHTSPLSPYRHPRWLLGAWFFMIIGLSGPQWIGAPLPLTQEGRHIFLILDISGSMMMPDMTLNHQPTTRLQIMKQAAADFVNRRPTDRLGLILFGSEAYLQTPLTYDHQTILSRLQAATVGLAGKTTSLGDALGLGIKKLQHTPRKGRVIILLTDGANNSGILSPAKAAELAKAAHIKLYTIGLAPPQTAMARLFMSMQQTGLDLDEPTLRALAKQTGGRYFRATDPTTLQHIYQTINLLETTDHKTAPVRPKEDYYPWCLLVAFILLAVNAYLPRLVRGIQQDRSGYRGQAAVSRRFTNRGTP